MNTTANTPLDVEHPGDENSNVEANNHPSILSKISKFIHDLDAEFPLSGGETQEDWEKNKIYLKHEAEHLKEEVITRVKNEVDHNFPLSGGQ